MIQNGLQGGLALLWHHFVDVKILHFMDRFISSKVHLHGFDSKFMFTGLYGEPRVDKRTQFWNYFAMVHLNINYPWIIMSDYNQILHPDDKSGGATPNLNLITMCRTILYNLQLKEVECKGNLFTWKRGNLMEKLDQAYGYDKWF